MVVAIGIKKIVKAKELMEYFKIPRETLRTMGEMDFQEWRKEKSLKKLST